MPGTVLDAGFTATDKTHSLCYQIGADMLKGIDRQYTSQQADYDKC